MHEFKLGKVAGLDLSAEPLAIAGSILLFFLLDNFFVFAFGALLPLGFTDGSTLLHWWGKR